MRKQKSLNLEVEVFKKSELPKKYTAKIFFRWDNRKFEDKYLKNLEKIQAKQKGKQVPSEVEP